MNYRFMKFSLIALILFILNLIIPNQARGELGEIHPLLESGLFSSMPKPLNFQIHSSDQAPDNVDRGFNPNNFYISYFDNINLTDYLYSEVFSMPIDFYLGCFVEDYPYLGCKFVEEMTDGILYSIRWQGNLIIPSDGNYTFGFAIVDDGARLFVDGVELMDLGWYSPDKQPLPKTLYLTSGEHGFIVDYKQVPQFAASLQLWWSGPGFEDEIVPLALPTSEIYSISGRVVDQQGNPLSGATITTNTGQSNITNTDGYYSIRELSNATYSLIPQKDGYQFSPSVKYSAVPPNRVNIEFVGLPNQQMGCDVPFYSQNDSRWKEHPLRTNNICSPSCNTIGACGCTLTSSAMVFSYYGAGINPADLSDCMGASACPFAWSVGAKCSKDKATFIGKSPFSWSTLDYELNQNHRPVILGMQKKSNTNLTHWVVVTDGQGDNPSNYIIHDPWFIGGANMKLSSRSNDYNFASLSIYSGTPICLQEFTDTTIAQSDPTMITSFSDEQIVGSVQVLFITEDSMTVQFDAQSLNGNITDMSYWTLEIPATDWQPYQSVVSMAKSDIVYVQFRDEFGNYSEIISSSIFPDPSPPDVGLDFLPLIQR